MKRLTETRIDPRDTSFTERQEIHYTVKKEKKFKAFDKLGKIESLMEKYHIESVEDLEEIILTSLLIHYNKEDNHDR